jgi:hypothetical protein
MPFDKQEVCVSSCQFNLIGFVQIFRKWVVTWEFTITEKELMNSQFSYIHPSAHKIVTGPQPEIIKWLQNDT